MRRIKVGTKVLCSEYDCHPEPNSYVKVNKWMMIGHTHCMKCDRAVFYRQVMWGTLKGYRICRYCYKEMAR